MQYDFLQHFPKRMKHVGMYGLLMQNSFQKQMWKNYGFLKTDEQLNIIFSLMLYLMEQSLKEENCTMDDMGAFLDYLNQTYYGKNMSYEDCRELADFIVNVILCNEGRAMYFDGYDYQARAYQTIHVSYIGNKVVYLEQEIRRTSFYLTDDGYNLLLSTLEIESNMKLTIHEMIFKMHLEKQSYDKAVDEVKNIFNLLRIQLQKIQEAILKVRRNALNYSVSDYKELLEENMETIDLTKQKFITYRDTVKKRAGELEEVHINVKKLSEEEEAKLKHLKTIEHYLNRGIDEHQRILNSHFDLKLLYDKELELLSQMSLIQRFSIRNELYDKLLADGSLLENIDVFYRPLFYQVPEKIYNINKSMELQRPIRKKSVTEEEEIISFDEEDWQYELLQKQKEKLNKYRKSLGFIMELVKEKKNISLKEIKDIMLRREEGISLLIPDINIFKEIMVELIKAGEINITALRKEKKEIVVEQTPEFQLHDMLLEIFGEDNAGSQVEKISIRRKIKDETVIFEGVEDELGRKRDIRCSDMEIILHV